MLQEIEHYYGPHVHFVNSSILQGLLAELCSPQTYQPRFSQLIETLYRQLLFHVIEKEFAVEAFSLDTRMTEFHPGAKAQGTRVSRKQKVICVDIARAGIQPSSVCYQQLHDFLPPENIRQDHIFASRTCAADQHVTGSLLSSVKIGGDKEESIVLFPDPMAATGSTLNATLNHYKSEVPGKWNKAIAIHLIVTPEYLRNVQKSHPDLLIYAIRLDRGLSPQAILNSPFGLHWDQERGLNDTDYIVPGGGGFGEIMNNSFV